MSEQTSSLSLEQMRSKLYTAVVCDALDSVGLRNQSPRIQWRQLSGDGILVGRCRTTLWADMNHVDPRPYELELQAVDACQPDDVLIAACAGSMRSAIWGELLSTAAKRGGCVGAIIDGAARDVRKMQDMEFPVFARGVSPYDSLNRQRVIDVDVPVAIDCVTAAPGDLVFADADGVVFVPQAVEREVIDKAWTKVNDENEVRDAIADGMKASDAFKKYGVL